MDTITIIIIAIVIILIIVAIVIVKGSRVVPENFCGVVYTFRKYSNTLQPGKYFIFPLIKNIRLVEMTPQTSENESKTVKTKDGLVIGIHSTIKWHVSNPVKALKATSYSQKLIDSTEQSVLRVSKESLLEELNNEYDKTCGFIKENINQAMIPWGVTVDEVQYEKIAPSYE